MSGSRLGPLPEEILAALADSPQALAAGSIRAILKAARGLYVSPEEIDAALLALLQAGRVERVWSRGIGRYRAVKPDPAAEDTA